MCSTIDIVPTPPPPPAPTPTPPPTASATPGTDNGACAALWAQCGGPGYGGPTTCCAGAGTCQATNEWWSMCSTIDIVPTSTPAPAPTPPPSATPGTDNGACAALWAQCGGPGYGG